MDKVKNIVKAIQSDIDETGNISQDNADKLSDLFEGKTEFFEKHLNAFMRHGEECPNLEDLIERAYLTFRIKEKGELPETDVASDDIKAYIRCVSCGASFEVWESPSSECPNCGATIK